jgi:hypothetical protein
VATSTLPLCIALSPSCSLSALTRSQQRLYLAGSSLALRADASVQILEREGVQTLKSSDLYKPLDFPVQAAYSLGGLAKRQLSASNPIRGFALRAFWR